MRKERSWIIALLSSHEEGRPDSERKESKLERTTSFPPLAKLALAKASWMFIAASSIEKRALLVVAIALEK